MGRDVSVTSMIGAASTASSKKISKKSPRRNRRTASGWARLASQYCCIAGVCVPVPRGGPPPGPLPAPRLRSGNEALLEDGARREHTGHLAAHDFLARGF